jgi:hypothetical protein
MVLFTKAIHAIARVAGPKRDEGYRADGAYEGATRQGVEAGKG